MEEFNLALRQTINDTFASLLKEIGNNRQQLFNKVLGIHKELNKELSKGPVDAQREKQVLHEVASVLRMAAGQLPHLRTVAPKEIAPLRPTPPPPPKKVEAPAPAPASPRPEPKKAAPETKHVPAKPVHKKPVAEKKAAPKKAAAKKAAPAKKTAAKKKK